MHQLNLIRFNTVNGRLNVSSRFTEKSSLIMDYKKVINLMNETMGSLGCAGDFFSFQIRQLYC